MRQEQILSGIAMALPAFGIATSVTLLGTQSAWAATSQVTGVQVNARGSSLELVLATKTGDKRPQIFPVNRGNDWVADIVNTQLSLVSGQSFSQENPMPGISAVTVSQLDSNSIRVTISGSENSPTGQIIQQEDNTITLGISAVVATQASNPIPVTSTSAQSNSATTSTLPILPNQQISQTPSNLPTSTNSIPPTQNNNSVTGLPTPTNSRTLIQNNNSPILIAQTPKPEQAAPTQATPPPQVPAPAPEVLFPNPKITIDGVPAAPSGTVQPVSPAPPLLPRAVAPPVGDIAVSNINAAASRIDLGSAAVIPRLSLREAPVREVLSLLARSAGLNLAYIGEGGGSGGDQAAQFGQPSPGGAGGSTITLDIENEPVQDVFNYVLQLSGLQANRQGRTIFVGAKLPQAARNIISRTLRLNQVTASGAANFLTAQGAETQIPFEQVQIQTVGEGAAARTIETRTPQILALKATETDAILLLRGLSVSTDERLNAITLVGEPRQVEMATALLTQLDLRRRQVAVNVKIVDINLLGTDAFNASFSFGIGDSFFSVDKGAAFFNYGGVNPPSNTTVSQNLASPAIIVNPFGPLSDNPGNVFIDPNNFITIPGGSPGTIRVTPSGAVITEQPRGDAIIRRPTVALSDPTLPGFTSITEPTDNIITETVDAATGVITRTISRGEVGTATTAIPALFQYPTRLLSALQAQITSGNGKILTDPTLVVQEGQRAIVQLTQEVYGGQKIGDDGQGGRILEPIIKNAGLTLDIQVNQIDDNGFVALSVNPTVSAPGSTVQNTGGLGEITLLQERKLQSGLIRLRDGQTLILSGIIQESDRTTVSKVPILGDIPILGALFRSTNRQNNRQEVIILLTPQILDDSERASFGYNYTPGRETQDYLERRGVTAPGRN